MPEFTYCCWWLQVSTHMQLLIRLINPNTVLNSQGTAVMMNAVSKLPEDVKKRVVGVVLFGYTKNGQTKSSIPNYPKENVMVLCSKSDGVCGGALLVTAGHFSYMGDGSGPKA